MWALKLDINLLNQHCKQDDWLDHRLIDWLRHLGTQGAQGTQILEHLSHSKGTRAIGHSRHLKGTWELGNSRHLDTWALRQLSTRTLEEHLGTQTLRQSKTWALEALEALYLADSNWRYEKKIKYKCINEMKCQVKILNNCEWSSKHVWKIVSADAKANKNNKKQKICCLYLTNI